MGAGREQLEEVLTREFGPPLDVAQLPEDMRFLFEHPQRIAEEALEAAFALDSETATEPYRLLAGFYRSSRLNAGTRALHSSC